MEVSEVMTPNPERAEVTETVRDGLHKLVELDVRHLPIVDQTELVGMISDRDLREYVVPMASELEMVNSSDARFERPLSDLMRGDVISVHPETDVSEVIELMIDHKIGAVPVIQPATGTLVGIVSYIDVIREAQDFFENL